MTFDWGFKSSTGNRKNHVFNVTMWLQLVKIKN